MDGWEFKAAPSAMNLLKATGMLAQVVLKGSQKIRGLDDEQRYRIRLVGALATCIARAALAYKVRDDVDIVDIKRVFIEVGTQVAKRGAGHDAIPKLTVH